MPHTEERQIIYLDIRAAIVFRYPNFHYHLDNLQGIYEIEVCGVRS